MQTRIFYFVLKLPLFCVAVRHFGGRRNGGFALGTVLALDDGDENNSYTLRRPRVPHPDQGFNIFRGDIGYRDRQAG